VLRYHSRNTWVYASDLIIEALYPKVKCTSVPAVVVVQEGMALQQVLVSQAGAGGGGGGANGGVSPFGGGSGGV
jgi:hypothetical protein